MKNDKIGFISIKDYIYNKKKKIKKYIKKIIKKFDKNVVFSIGENCLADNILARNNLKSFSSPYASARSNIEYLLAFEREKFVDFLNNDYLCYRDITKNIIAFNKKYIELKNNYHNSCSNGFEFTHHDVINKQTARDQIERRYKRLLSLRNKNIIMLYHHRFCVETDEDLLIENLRELAEIYKARNNNVCIYLFSQVIISSDNSRRLESFEKNGINVYKFYTKKEWAGDDENLLWARCDDDLISKMIDDIKNKLI